jgi:hypothetical protein
VHAALATRPKKQRFIAPARSQVDLRRFEAPIFDDFRRHASWWNDAAPPSFEAMNAALDAAIHPHSGAALRFVEQTPALLDDGLHYEQRIYERGEIATRADNWHDLFNALIWIEHGAIKAALNARQVADIARLGKTERSRAQCALTQFDEAGAVVLLRDPALLQRWDAHDWHGLFWQERAAWNDGRAKAIVFGHALLEHALQPHPVHTAKGIAVQIEANGKAGGATTASICAQVAAAIATGKLLNDPQDSRPLPLSGLPGWHPDALRESFFLEAPCFRPLREGRRYPSPWLID